MDRLRQPGNSDYDVLGVSSGATDEEIRSAFSRLIYDQGYRVGVPVEQQWERARQITAAHARLGDPVKRRAYDESLGLASDPGRWVATATDDATDELILSERAPEPAEQAENLSAPDAVVSPAPAEEPLTEANPETAPNWMQELEAEEGDWFRHDRPPPLYLARYDDDQEASDPESQGSKRAAAGSWAVAMAGASALALVLLAWSWDRQLPAGESRPGVTAAAWKASGARPGQSSAQAAGNSNGAAASVPEAQQALVADLLATPSALLQPPELQSASNVGVAQPVGAPATTNVVEAQSPPEPMLTVPAASPAEGSPSPVAVAETQPAPAPLPPIASVAATAAASETATTPDSLIRSPAQWLGGGPTDADNRKGRYQGTIAVQVIVEPDGRVSRCAPVTGSGNAELDAMTCRLIRERAQFSPAIDAAGRPVASEAYTSFVWGRKRRK